MKKIILLLVLGTFFCFDVTAKYVYPEGSTTTTERRVNRRMKRYDTDSNEELSLKEYENYREPRTRDERRMERRAKKKGTYVSPEDAFKQMDKNGDGEVTRDEMLEYEKSRLMND